MSSISLDIGESSEPSGGLLKWLLGRKSETRTPGVREELSRDDRFMMRHGAMVEDICEFLARAGLDPIPDHYELAWLYLAGASSTQRHMIEAHMLEHGGISPVHASGLLDVMRNAISERELAAMVEKAKSDINEAQLTADRSGQDVANFGAALGVSVDSLSNPEAAREAISKLQVLTQNMMERAAKAEAELRERSKAMSQLKSRLVQSQKQALSDALTGLPNRRAFDLQLDEAIEVAHETKKPLSVAFCDIDFFKKVNDTHGHAVGDRVIKHVAQVLKNCAGAKAHVARHGGEEYALLFENMNASLACDLLNSARARLDAKRLVAKDTNVSIGEVTISCGVATLQIGETGASMLSRADQALYEAKNTGRNRICIAP
ncbi:diguanylate cyclase [Sphingorhabdus contaminans]|uniref:diguanylate cyclase n=1 Tax=Sphingorhabdus contaminans TaxID=1343899 RepID=A0A553WGR3_9SPHN|nr:diguanylate cyclase [Sphingorhabdus contaminans]